MSKKASFILRLGPGLAALACLSLTACKDQGTEQWTDLRTSPADNYGSGSIQSWLARYDPCDPPEPEYPSEGEEPLPDPGSYVVQPSDVFPPGSIGVVYPSSDPGPDKTHLADGEFASMYVPAGWQPVQGGPLQGAFAAQTYFYIQGGAYNGMYSTSQLYHVDGGRLNTSYSTMKLYHYDAGPLQSEYSRLDKEHITTELNFSKYKSRGWIHVDSAGPSHTSYVPPDFKHYAEEGPFKSAYLPPGWYHETDPAQGQPSRLRKPCD